MRLLMCGVLAFLTAMAPVKLLAKDVALLIANVDNSRISDAAAVNAELGEVIDGYRRDGYTVLVRREADGRSIRNVVREFESESRDADRVVVHFVGDLAVTHESVFLKPVGFSSSAITDLHTSTLGIELVYDLLSHRPGRNALILATSYERAVNKILFRGPIPNGLLVLAGSGLETNRAVKDGLLQGETGVEVGGRSGVAAIGFVADIPLAGRVAQTSPSGSAADAALIEMRVWRDAAQNGSLQALQNYINRYPNGLFRGEAQARLDALSPPKSAEQRVEEGLRLSRNDRRSIQKNLTLLGFNTRGVDGLFGPGSRSAIERWQRKEGFRTTGYLDRAQIRVLNESARVKAEADRVSRERDDVAYWQQTGSGTNERGLRDYLAKYPAGLFATQAKQGLDRMQQNGQSQQNEALVQRENALQMTAKTRQLVEQRLVGLGYNTGPVDGNFTRETRVAIRAFQQKSGINPTGYMDNQTVTRLVASIFR